MPESQDIRPGVDLHKKTTKVNAWVVIGVLTFFIVMGFVTCRINRDPPASTQEMQQTPLP